MPTLHSHTRCQVPLTVPQAKTWQKVCLSNRTSKTPDKPTDEKEHRSDNTKSNSRKALKKEPLSN